MSLPNSILYNEFRYSCIFKIYFTRYFLSAAVPKSSKFILLSPKGKVNI